MTPRLLHNAAYLVHLKGTGASRASLRKLGQRPPQPRSPLDLRDGDRIHQRDIEAAATLWSEPRGRRSATPATSKARQRFVSHQRPDRADRLAGDYAEGELRTPPPALQAYERWLRDERGPATASIESYRRAAGTFLQHSNQR